LVDELFVSFFAILIYFIINTWFDKKIKVYLYQVRKNEKYSFN
jgi:hypothetical protein